MSIIGFIFLFSNLKLNIIRGSSNCSIEGLKYELQVYNTIKNCCINNKLFNTQNKEDLGGSKYKNDIECNFNSYNDIPIEIKKINAPDWMQCSLKYNEKTQKWLGSAKNKIPLKSKQLFEMLIKDMKLFNGNIPPFMIKNITYDNWREIKNNNHNYNDIYINCPNTTIRDLYANKGCYYIQISEKGLYHLGNDICNFNVPEFICEQQLRIRTKVHNKKNKKGYCNLSVIISCKPKNIKKLMISSFSLDNINRLPLNMY